MNPLISERFLVDAQHRISITDKRLTPGDEVEVIVRSTSANAKPASRLLDLAQTVKIDAPADYSVNFEQVLR
jgi:hypothetical protein